MAFISPPFTQCCCWSWWYWAINKHPVQQTRRSHCQRRYRVSEHGHAGAPACEHTEPWRHARPHQPAALREHRRAEQSGSHGGRDRLRRWSPDRGESFNNLVCSLIFLVRSYRWINLKHFQVFEPTHHLDRSKLVQHFNHGLWVIIMCQCMFISWNKCNSPAGDVDNGKAARVCRGREYGKSLYLLLNFAVNLK